MTKFVISMVLAGLAQGAWGSNLIECERALRFLGETVPSMGTPQFGNSLASSSPEFQNWLGQNHLTWSALEDGAKNEALGQFYGAKLRPYQESEVAKRRVVQLNEDLEYRGVHNPYKDGYETLKWMSAQNLEHLLEHFQNTLGHIPLKTAPLVQARISKAVSSLEFIYAHNTSQLKHNPSFPLLSARELAAMGIHSSLNTGPFNRLTLKSDGNIFFFAIPHVKSTPFPEVTSRYGTATILLDDTFARHWGWMSPYIMDPSDLMKVAAKEARDELTQFKYYLRANFPEYINEDFEFTSGRFEKVPPEAYLAMLRQLHHYDMTPQDYQKAMQETLRISLEAMYLNHSSEFETVMSDLEQGRNLDEILKLYSLGRAGIPFDGGSARSLELKVPVSIPLEALTYRNTTSKVEFLNRRRGFDSDFDF